MQAGETINADVGEARTLSGVYCALDRAVQRLKEMVAVVKTGHQILAADLAQLFQFGIVAFCANDSLDARLAIVAGRRKVHACLEAAAISANPAADQFGAALQALIVLQKAFELALITGSDQVNHWHAFELFNILVAKQLQIGSVGVDMHAVVDIGNCIHRTLQQQLAALFGFA